MKKYRMVLPSGRALLTRMRSIERNISARLEAADKAAEDNQAARMAAWSEATNAARYELARLVGLAVLDNHVKKGALNNE